MPVDSRAPWSFASELKFLVDAAAADRVRAWARQHLASDPNGGGPWGDEYQTTSLYLDTEQFDVFHRRGSFGRSKYRIRRYGQDDVVFLERKFKRSGRLNKRRTAVAVDSLARLSEARPEQDWGGYWFHRRMLARRLQPVCEVSYHRTARVGTMEGAPVRLTIDEQVSTCPAKRIGLSMDSHLPAIAHRCVVEMKYRDSVPALLRRLVEECALDARAVSKYRLSVAALGLVAPGPPGLDDSDLDGSYA